MCSIYVQVPFPALFTFAAAAAAAGVSGLPRRNKAAPVPMRLNQACFSPLASPPMPLASGCPVSHVPQGNTQGNIQGNIQGRETYTPSNHPLSAYFSPFSSPLSLVDAPWDVLCAS